MNIIIIHQKVQNVKDKIRVTPARFWQKNAVCFQNLHRFGNLYGYLHNTRMRFLFNMTIYPSF